MALVLKDRVQETTTTSGTGTLTLSGAVSGFQTFSTAIGNGNTTFYTIYDNTAYVWEVGIGTVGAGTLARTTVLSNSSGTTTPISLAGNTAFVFCTYPAEKSINYDANGVATIGETLGYSDSGIIASFASTVAGYNQVVLQNKSTANNASTNFNVSNDAGTAGSNYAELGINSSTFSGTGSFNIAGASYVASASTDLTLGTYGAYSIHFVTNSSTTDAMTIFNNGGISLGGFANPGIANMAASKFVPGYTSVTAAAGTTVLTASSNYYQNLVGTTTQTIQLPDATGLLEGTTFVFDNDSTGTLTVVDNASGPIETVPSGAASFVYLADNATVAGTWRRHAFLPASYDFNATTANFGNATITNAVWNGTTIGTAYGGTGLTSFSAANYALYSINSSTLTAGTLPIAAGGTGATTDSGARTSLGLGTIATQDANNVAITGGAIDGTTIGATTASTGRFTSVTTPSVTATSTDLTLSAISTGAVNLNTANGTGFKVLDVGTTTARFVQAYGASSSGTPSLSASAGNLIISSGASSNLAFFTNSINQEQMRVSHTASAVNFVQVTGAATGGNPSFTSTGSDANVSLEFRRKGTGNFQFYGDTYLGVNGNNSFLVSGASTGLSPTVLANGSDTNIPISLRSKGTGAINLAAGSSGVNISNGGTVTAITRTGAGINYTSAPTPAITAPTTAGGVQATATVTIGLVGINSIGSGGTGYTVNDVLTVSGGTFTVACQVTVTAVSGGVITAASVTTGGSYTVAPTNPASVTGGTGTGATFNLSFGISTAFTITNAGSGYIEQPTITFSGGGGSGAAAYATVGSGTTVKTLGSSISFNVPSSEVLRLSDGSSAACYLNLQSSSTTIQGFASSSGSNVGYQWVTKGVSNHSFATNNSVSTEQFRVSHTASAVNYVQVTGATTLNPPVISSQGSDSTIAMIFQAKGGQNFRFFSAAGSAEQFRVIHTAGTIANYAQATGNVAGSAPSFSVNGSDTNIGLTLTPKGTGVVSVSTAIANTRINPRVLASTANSATPTLNTDNFDMMVITGQSVAITSFTTNLTGTPVNGQKLWISITGTTSIAITWGASFEASTVPLPTTTDGTNRLDVGFVWNVANADWRCVAVA